MKIIEIKNLTRNFKILNRGEGLSGAFKALFSRDYRVIEAVKNISLDIEQGEIVGFIGPNGAGKSTTIKMLTGVLKPTSGSIIANGYVPSRDRIKYIKNVGVVFGQRSQLWWDIPVIESFKLLKAMFKVSDFDYKQNLEIFNDLLGIEKLYNMPVRNMSLGQRMLCDIAAAFLHNPQIIFLDEPTIGLDIAVKKRIRKIIRDLNRLKKTTILLTSHDMFDIEKLCKRLVIIDMGTIIYDGLIDSFNKQFGSYRTLKVEFDDLESVGIQRIIGDLSKTFSIIFEAEVTNNNWVHLAIDEKKIKSIKILNYITDMYDVRDVKIEEMPLESLIHKVYEGDLE